MTITVDIRRPPLGGHQAERHGFQSQFTSPAVFIQSPMAILQSASQQAGDWYLVIRARGRRFNHPRPWYSEFGWSQAGSQNPLKFQPVPRTLPNHQNPLPDTQKASKMRTQSIPVDPQIANKLKSCNLTKTSVLPWF